MVQITPRRIFTTLWKSPTFHQNSPFPNWEGRFPHNYSNAIWRTVACFTFQSRSVEIIFTHFSVWLWTVTQFNIPKNELSLNVLLVIGNGLLIPTLKYWLWIKESKYSQGFNLRECWLLFYSKLCVGVPLGFS